MKKIFLSICLLGMLGLYGCDKTHKTPSICTDGISNADKAISNIENSSNIPPEYKSQPISHFRENKATIENAIKDKSLNHQQLISTCTTINDEITHRISLFNY